MTNIKKNQKFLTAQCTMKEAAKVYQCRSLLLFSLYDFSLWVSKILKCGSHSVFCLNCVLFLLPSIDYMIINHHTWTSTVIYRYITSQEPKRLYRHRKYPKHRKLPQYFNPNHVHFGKTRIFMPHSVPTML